MNEERQRFLLRNAKELLEVLERYHASDFFPDGIGSEIDNRVARLRYAVQLAGMYEEGDNSTCGTARADADTQPKATPASAPVSASPATTPSERPTSERPSESKCSPQPASCSPSEASAVVSALCATEAAQRNVEDLKRRYVKCFDGNCIPLAWLERRCRNECAQCGEDARPYRVFDCDGLLFPVHDYCEFDFKLIANYFSLKPVLEGSR